VVDAAPQQVAPEAPITTITLPPAPAPVVGVTVTPSASNTHFPPVAKSAPQQVGETLAPVVNTSVNRLAIDDSQAVTRPATPAPISATPIAANDPVKPNHQAGDTVAELFGKDPVAKPTVTAATPVVSADEKKARDAVEQLNGSEPLTTAHKEEAHKPHHVAMSEDKVRTLQKDLRELGAGNMNGAGTLAKKGLDVDGSCVADDGVLGKRTLDEARKVGLALNKAGAHINPNNPESVLHALQTPTVSMEKVLAELKTQNIGQVTTVKDVPEAANAPTIPSSGRGYRGVATL
jgi:hypothetical protein